MKKLLLILLPLLLVSCSENKTDVLKALENCADKQTYGSEWENKGYNSRERERLLAMPLKDRLKVSSYSWEFRGCEKEYSNSPITFMHDYGD